MYLRYPKRNSTIVAIAPPNTKQRDDKAERDGQTMVSVFFYGIMNFIIRKG